MSQLPSRRAVIAGSAALAASAAPLAAMAQAAASPAWQEELPRLLPFCAVALEPVAPPADPWDDLDPGSAGLEEVYRQEE